MSKKHKIAVLALQGDYEKHIGVLTNLGQDAFPARLPADIARADAVVLPGGESTTIGKLMTRYGVDDALRDAYAKGRPIYGTCAGLILLAREIAPGTGERGGQPTLGLLDVVVVRNGFGRQVDSFETPLDIPAIEGGPVPAMFIRAPYITDCGAGIEKLATYDGRTVFVRQGAVLGSAFHPELSGDDRIHRYFLTFLDKG